MPADVAHPTTWGRGLFNVFLTRMAKMVDSYTYCVILSTRLLPQTWGIEKSMFYHMRKISRKVVQPNWSILLPCGISIDFFKKKKYTAPVKKNFFQF